MALGKDIKKIINSNVEIKKGYHQGNVVWSGLVSWNKYNSILQYTWRRYYTTTTTSYVESSLSTGTQGFYVFEYVYKNYSLNTSTGTFSVSNQVFFQDIPNSSYFYLMNENNLRKHLKDSYYNQSTYTEYTSKQESSTVRGTYIGTVSSTSSTAYPTNGQSGSYWYDTRTSAYIRGTTNYGTVEADEGTYPNNGRHTDGFWYVKI